MSHMITIAIAASLLPVSLVSVARAQNLPAAPGISLSRFTSVAEIAGRTVAPGVAVWSDPDAPTAPAKQAALRGSRSRGKIALGVGLIGTGLVFLIANPDMTTQTILTERGQLYKQGYHARLIGGVFVASGGVSVLSGLRRR
jgi:hypothetical protein